MKVALGSVAKRRSRPPPSLCDARGFLLLAVLPFCNIGGFVWCYTALPLHWVDSDWPLWQLSTLMFITYVPRVCTTVLTGRVGDWICVPISGIATGCSILMIMRPDSPAAVWVAMSAISCAVNPPALRSLVHKRFQGSGTWQMQRALRMYTLADAIGYACAPFIGGVLYDTRGLAACAAFSCVTNSACALLTLHLLGCRQAFVVRVRPDQSPGPSEAGTDHGSSQAEGARYNSADPAHMKAEANAVVGVPVTRAYYGWPLSVLMVAAYTNICVYAVEWNLYALYFRIEHDWSGTWCGFCQMISELIGAAVLGASTMTCVATGARCWNCPRAGIALMRPPFGIAVVLGSHGVLMIMLAQPQFVTSLLDKSSWARRTCSVNSSYRRRCCCSHMATTQSTDTSSSFIIWSSWQDALSPLPSLLGSTTRRAPLPASSTPRLPLRLPSVLCRLSISAAASHARRQGCSEIWLRPRSC